MLLLLDGHSSKALAQKHGFYRQCSSESNTKHIFLLSNRARAIYPALSFPTSYEGQLHIRALHAHSNCLACIAKCRRSPHSSHLSEWCAHITCSVRTMTTSVVICPSIPWSKVVLREQGLYKLSVRNRSRKSNDSVIWRGPTASIFCLFNVFSLVSYQAVTSILRYFDTYTIGVLVGLDMFRIRGNLGSKVFKLGICDGEF